MAFVPGGIFVVIHPVSTYKGHVRRDTFWRLVKFLGKIRDRLVLVDKFPVAIDIFTMKLPYNEAKFWDRTIQNSGKTLGQHSLKSTLSLISGNCVYSPAFVLDTNIIISFKVLVSLPLYLLDIRSLPSLSQHSSGPQLGIVVSFVSFVVFCLVWVAGEVGSTGLIIRSEKNFD